MTRTRAAGVALAAIALLSACGSSSGGGGGGEADKTAAQILADAVSALRSAKSVHITAKSTDTTSPNAVDLDLDLAAGGSASGTVGTQGVTASVVVTGGKFYVRGRDFWAKVAGAEAATVIGDRWAILPASADTSAFTSFVNVNTLADCLNLDHGTLSKGGTATFDGQAAVVLVDKGDQPGTAPGKLYVAASGATYPLSLQVTGAAKAGTSPAGDKCNGGASGSSKDTGTVTFSDYGKVVTVTPPPDALDLQSLAGGGG